MNKKKIFGVILIAIFLVGAPIFYINSKKTSWENDILGQIINCRVDGVTEKTFTLNADGTFKMMILPFDVWGTYELANFDEKSGKTEVIFTAKNLYSSKGNRTDSLKEKPLKWQMSLDFGKKNDYHTSIDTVKMAFSEDEKSAIYEVISGEKQVYRGCFVE